VPPPQTDLEAPVSSPVNRDAERKEEHEAAAAPMEPQQHNDNAAADVVSQPNLIVHATQ
jgi:hypothetical protein